MSNKKTIFEAADNEQLLLVSDIVLNEENPREQDDEEQQNTIQSLLVFPKMLRKRRISLDNQDTKIVLGGNMRTLALLWIRDASKEDIIGQLTQQGKFHRMTEYEQEQLVEAWLNWQKNPLVPVQYCDDFTDEEQEEFIVKDNLSYGKWDWDKLANKFNSSDLEDWGLDCWQNPDDEEQAGTSQPKEQKDLSEEAGGALQLVIECDSEEQQEQLYNEMIERGLSCQVLTL